MIRICHIAYLHIFNTKRHKEYTEIFTKLYKSLKDNNVDAIFLVGDIFHSKTKLSPESVSIVIKLLENLQKVTEGPVVIIPGNHDLAISNKDRLDSITPVVEALNGKIVKREGKQFVLENKLIYLRGAGNYKVRIKDKVCRIGHFGISEPEKWDDVEEGDIALYHGVVRNSQTDAGFIFQDTGVPISIFSGFKSALLGDIHKQQFLSNNIAYPGSCITQNFGENIYKGYLIWEYDDEWNVISSKSINIPNDYAHYTLIINEDGSFPTADEIPKHPILRIFVRAPSLSSVEIKSIEQRVIEKYNPTEIRSIQCLSSNVRIERFNQIETDITDLGNVWDVAVQNKYLEEYFKDELNESDIEQVKKLNDGLQPFLPTLDIERNIHWSINKLTMNNFMHYKENNVLNFNQLKGVVGIVGNNKVGKSTLLCSIAYGIFKASPHPSLNMIDLVNGRKKKMSLSLELSCSSNKYLIDRHIKINKRRYRSGEQYEQLESGVTFTQVDINGNEKNIAGDSKWDTEDNIRKIFGTYDDYKLTTFIQQNKSLEFIDDKRAKEKKEILSRFLGLDVFGFLKLTAKEQFDTIEKKYNTFEPIELLKEIKDKRSIIDSEEDRLYTLKRKLREVMLIKQDKGIELERLRTSIHLIALLKDGETEETLLELKKRIESNKENKANYIETLKTKKKDSEAKIEKIERINKMMEELQPIYSESISRKKKLDILISNKHIIDSDERHYVRMIQILKKQPWCQDRRCTFLKDAFDAQDKLVKTNKQIIEIDDKIAKINKWIDSRKKKLEKYEQATAAREEILRIKNEFIIVIKEIEKESAEFLNLLDQFNRVKETLNILEENKKKIEENSKKRLIINEKIAEILVVEKSIALLTKNRVESETLLNEHEKRLEEIETRYAEYKSLEEKYRILKLYLRAVDVDGIPLYIIKSVIPVINTEISKLLSTVDFSITLEINEEGTEIQPFITDVESKRRIEAASGMEKTIAGLAIRTALISLSSLPKSNFLVIDEIFGVFDSDYLNNCSRIFEQLRQQFEYIFVISHIPDILDFCDSMINVSVDENGFSFIESVK